MRAPVVTKKQIKHSALSWLVLAPLIIVILFPFAVMVTTAIKPRAEILAFPPTWLPSEIRLMNIVEMWRAEEFGRVLFNSIYVAVLSTALSLSIAIPAAYAMARIRFPGKSMYRLFLVFTQMISPIILIVGLFRLLARWGFIDNLNGLVIANAAFATAFSVWMLQSYFATIPREVEEAAVMDGASRLQTMIRIFLPLSGPAVAVAAAFGFVNAWNEFVLSMTFLTTEDLFTVPLKIVIMAGGLYVIEWHFVMGATVLATVPVAIVFSWLQTYLVKGLALGAVK